MGYSMLLCCTSSEHVTSIEACRVLKVISMNILGLEHNVHNNALMSAVDALSI